MLQQWIALTAAVALLALGVPAGAATTDTAKTAPAPAATAPAATPPAATTPAASAPAATTPSAPAASTPASPGRAPKVKMSPTPKKNLVNINAASAAQLKALPGGSDAEAARIIAGRPYGSKAFLLSNKVIDAGRYEEIKALIVAGEPAKPTAAKK